MALLSRKEYASSVGVSLGIINTNVSRGKIKVRPDKLIDSDDPLNKAWLKLRLANQKKREATKKIADIKKPPPEVKEVIVETFSKPTPNRSEADMKKSDEDSEEMVSWQARKIKADALKAEKDAELKQLQLDKMMGKLMPVDLFRSILKINIQNVFMSFENELVNLGSVYCDILADGDRGKLSEITEKMREDLSRIIKDTEANAAQEVQGVINEYAETRSRGERK